MQMYIYNHNPRLEVYRPFHHLKMTLSYNRVYEIL